MFFIVKKHFSFCVILIILIIFVHTNISFAEETKSYIKWVDFDINSSILTKIAKLDIDSHTNKNSVPLNFVEILAYLANKYGGNFSNFSQKDLNSLVEKLKNGNTIEYLTKDSKYYNYYHEVYETIFGNFIGEYSSEKEDENGNRYYKTSYGIKAFSPIAKNYYFNHYRDFGSSRSYGYKRLHLGNDLMGSIGTPVIAVESGIVEAAGWNQYGGWRIGIRSFDGKKYYYYAHLRKDHPFAEDMYEGKIVTAGDVIGYLGMTGYSSKENVNNINVPHLHFGLQLIFDESQKDGTNQIWIDVYDIIDFLQKYKSQVYQSNKETKDYSRKYNLIDYDMPRYLWK